MSKQYVVLVDKDNNEIGKEEKLKVHQEGVLHRAFSIFVFNSRGELLLQQRDINKYHAGGLWANTVCSHPKPGESYDLAIHRRMEEEMGFDCDLEKLFCFIYKADVGGGLTEHEYDCVFVGVSDLDPNPNPEEVMNYEWVPTDKLLQDVKDNPDKYAPWFKIILDKVNLSDIKDKLDI